MGKTEGKVLKFLNQLPPPIAISPGKLDPVRSNSNSRMAKK
jgi:hypothetical protein